LFRSFFLMASVHGLGAGQIARNYGVLPSDVFSGALEYAESEIERARREGFRDGKRAAYPLRRAS